MEEHAQRHMEHRERLEKMHEDHMRRINRIKAFNWKHPEDGGMKDEL